MSKDFEKLPALLSAFFKAGEREDVLESARLFHEIVSGGLSEFADALEASTPGEGITAIEAMDELDATSLMITARFFMTHLAMGRLGMDMDDDLEDGLLMVVRIIQEALLAYEEKHGSLPQIERVEISARDIGMQTEVFNA